MIDHLNRRKRYWLKRFEYNFGNAWCLLKLFRVIGVPEVVHFCTIWIGDCKKRVMSKREKCSLAHLRRFYEP